jgi:hypothetical protein
VGIGKVWRRECRLSGSVRRCSVVAAAFNIFEYSALKQNSKWPGLGSAKVRWWERRTSRRLCRYRTSSRLCRGCCASARRLRLSTSTINSSVGGRYVALPVRVRECICLEFLFHFFFPLYMNSW